MYNELTLFSFEETPNVNQKWITINMQEKTYETNYYNTSNTVDCKFGFMCYELKSNLELEALIKHLNIIGYKRIFAEEVLKKTDSEKVKIKSLFKK